MPWIRKADLKDIETITSIYNDAILHTTATFDTEIKSVGNRREWLLRHSVRYPVIVAGFDSDAAGYASLSEWSDKCAYKDTAEISIYVKEELQGKGIGKLLMNEILKLGDEAGIHSIIARIAEGNEGSIKIHEIFGFTQIGVMKEVGMKFGKLLDVYLLQKIYHLNR